MTQLANKRILLGITGGIAAYKAAELTRLLTKAGAEVQHVMTDGAQAFITPLTLQALSGKPVRTTLLDEQAEAGMGHIELAKWADLVIIAPATADFLARLNAGIANDLLSTICLATEASMLIAPAMNQAMWHNPVTQRNIKQLSHAYDNRLTWIGPEPGEQACGDVGYGRMSEPEQIVAAAESHFSTGELTGKTVLLTAGPTRELLDPVRYISNFSSGKMGYALAAAARDAGARVIIISGPVSLPTPNGIEIHSVTSAQQMYDKAMELSPSADVFIATAAVADFRAAEMAEHKIKKKPDGNTMTIKLTRNPDIVASVAGMTSDRPFVVGFAAETRDALTYGRDKLERKNLDLVVVNDVSLPDLGFGSDRNLVTVVGNELEQTIGPDSKTAIAHDLIDLISKQID